MAKKKPAKGKKRSLAKPKLSAQAKQFAGGSKSNKGTSGKVPFGDTRLTANIRIDLHKKLKHAAVDHDTTVGELLESLIDKHL